MKLLRAATMLSLATKNPQTLSHTPQSSKNTKPRQVLPELLFDKKVFLILGRGRAFNGTRGTDHTPRVLA